MFFLVIWCDKNLSTERNGRSNMFKRDKYLNELINKGHNHLIKVITCIFHINKIIHSFVVTKELSDNIALFVETGIELVFLGIFGTAFAFLIYAILKRKTPKVSMILLLVGFGLEFAFITYSGIMSISLMAKDKNSPHTSYYYNGIPTTYTKVLAGSIVSMILSLTIFAGFIVIVVLSMLSFRKAKLKEKKVTANGN